MVRNAVIDEKSTPNPAYIFFHAVFCTRKTSLEDISVREYTQKASGKLINDQWKCMLGERPRGKGQWGFVGEHLVTI